MTIQSTQLIGGKNPTKYIEQYIGSAIDHIVHVSANLALLNDIYSNLPAIDILDDYASAIQTVADQINSNSAIIQGAQGSQGALGAQGPQGVAGAGAQGAVGSQGATGAQGPSGLQGHTGSAGPTGNTGLAGTIPHISTTTGNWMLGTVDTTVQAQGINGVDGADGVGVIWQPAIATSAMLPTLPYANETDAFYVNNTGNAFRYSMSLNNWINIGNRKGATGSQGAIGTQGSAGSNGIDGNDGTDGLDGDNAYTLWVAQDPANNTSTEVQWLASLAGGEYGTIVTTANDLASLEAHQGQRRDVETSTPGLLLTYAYFDSSPKAGINSSFVGQNGKWVDVTSAVFVDATNFAVTSIEQGGAVGLSSTCVGFSSEATRVNATSYGNGSIVRTPHSTAIGQGNILRELSGSGNDQTVSGRNNDVKGTANTVQGTENVVSARRTITLGSTNNVHINDAVTFSPMGVSYSAGSTNPMMITNDETHKAYHNIDSVLVGSGSATTLVRSIVFGKQLVPANKTFVDVVALGHNAAPDDSVDSFTGIGSGAGTYADGDLQGVMTVGGSLIFKTQVGSPTASDGWFKLFQPLMDSANTKNDGTKVLSSNTQGYAKWVDPSTLTTTPASPTWTDLSNKLIGGAFNRVSNAKFEYMVSGNIVLIRGSISFNSAPTAPASITLATNLPSAIAQSGDHKIIASAIDYDNPTKAPTIVEIEGTSMKAHLYVDQSVSVAAPVAPEVIGVTTVVDGALPVNFTFNMTIGA